MLGSRVPQRAFERLELHEGKLSRAVLRGGGGGNATSLPGLWGATPRATRPEFPDTEFPAEFPVETDSPRRG